MPALYVAIHLVLFALLAALTAVFTRKSRKAGLAWVAGVVGGGLSAQLALFVFARPLANALAWPDLFFFHTFTVHIAGAVFVAVVLMKERGAVRARAGVLALILLVLASYGNRNVFFAPPPLRDHKVDVATIVSGVTTAPALVRQTEVASCAPAAAATLLRALKIDSDASERELASLSFTHPTKGTTDVGLFRGLSLAAPGRAVRFRWRTLAEIRAATPCVVFVSLDRDRVPDEETFALLRDQCNWNPGESHAVVCFGFARDGQGEQAYDVALIGDPNYGHERWPLDHFMYLWDGTSVEIE